MSRGGAAGAYGKIGSQADFFRTNAGEFSQAGLDRWFEAALETLRTEGGRLPEGPTEFLLAPPGTEKVFLGAFAPSTDAAGRSFPLIVFAEFASSTASRALGALSASAGPFLSAARALAVEGGRLPGSELVDRVGALFAPEPSDDFKPGAHLAIDQEPADALISVLDGSPRALGYALRTMGLACDQASKYGPNAATGVITVDAPAPTSAIRHLWIELARRRLHWAEGHPSLLWTPPSGEMTGRLLLTLGPPSVSVLGYLANPRHRSPRFWPLRTDVTVALDQAFQALSPEQRRLVESPSIRLGELVTTFGA